MLVAMLLLTAAAPPRPAEPHEVADAVRRGLVRVQAAGTNWPRHRQCFSCHNQTLPLLAVVEAGHGDPAWLKSQADIAHAHFTSNLSILRTEKHIGGGAVTVSYGLWALQLAGRSPDTTTEAMVGWLLRKQLKNGLWGISCRRLPSQGSVVSLAVLCVTQMKAHATTKQRPAVEKATRAALAALNKASLPATEDLAFRLWGLHLLGGSSKQKAASRAALVAAQRADGGWGQTKTRASDAYATGQALYILQATGSGRDDPAVRRAAWFLVRTQYADGSWLVKTHTHTVQRNFDNGDPHGRSQFISVAGTAWATAALARLRQG